MQFQPQSGQQQQYPQWSQQQSPPPLRGKKVRRPRSKKSLWAIGCGTLIGILLLFGLCSAIASIGKSASTASTPTPTESKAAISQVIPTTAPTVKPTQKPTSIPTLRPTPKPQPTQPPVKPTPTKPACQGVNNNPWCYNFTSPGKFISIPPIGFCNYFNCIPTFYAPDDPGDGYIVQCVDGTYSQSGGESGACSHHGGMSRPLYSH